MDRYDSRWTDIDSRLWTDIDSRFGEIFLIPEIAFAGLSVMTVAVADLLQLPPVRKKLRSK